MSCNRMEDRILPYVDGRLKAGEVKEMEAHLKTCAACELRVNEFRALSGLLDELPQIEPSGAFDARVRARVAAEPVKQSWWSVFAPSPTPGRAAFASLTGTEPGWGFTAQVNERQSASASHALPESSIGPSQSDSVPTCSSFFELRL